MSETIDFEKEVRRLMKKQVSAYTREVHIVSLCKSIAARVEESTIQRCYRILMTEQGGIPRLYSPKPDGEVKK